MEGFKTMINLKTFGVLSFVGISLVAYGCSSDDTPATPTTTPDAGGNVADTGSNATNDAGECKKTQAPTDYDKCFTFSSQASPAAQPVTTKCLPAELQNERPTGFDFGAFVPGDWLLTEAYDLSPDCAQPKTVVESLKHDGLFVNVTAEYTARPDGAVGKTAAQYVRLPPPPPDPDAGDAEPADAGPPPPQYLSLPSRTCPPSPPQVNCIPLDTWFQSGFYNATPTELRLYMPGPPADGGMPDPSTAKLYAVYKKAQ